MPRSLNMRITPLTMAEFKVKYASALAKSDSPNSTNYYKYLTVNEDIHHYAPYENKKEWWWEECSK